MEKLKKYSKIINGIMTVKLSNQIIVIKNDFQYINPTHEMLIEDGWEEYITPIYKPSEEELLKRSKQDKLFELIAYDESSEVNDCIIRYQGQEVHYWADKHERDALKSAVRDCITLGRDKYRLDLRNIGVSLWMPCEDLLGILAQLEVYTIDCYNKTTDHEYAIKQLTTIDEIKNYNYRTGYPEKLTFDL